MRLCCSQARKPGFDRRFLSDQSKRGLNIGSNMNAHVFLNLLNNEFNKFSNTGA